MKQMDPKALIALKIKAAKKRGASQPSGKFPALADKLAQQPGVRNPQGLAASIGKKKANPFG